MKRILIAAAALAAPFASGGAAMADPGDHSKKQWEKRAKCEKKLYEAKSPRDFHQKLAECNRELAKLGWEQRKEAAKHWPGRSGASGDAGTGIIHTTADD
jgi:hypothetical protein